MQEIVRRYWYLGLAIISFIAAAYFENKLLRDDPEIYLIKEFQEKLVSEENKLDRYISEVLPLINSKDSSNDYFTKLHIYNHLFENDGFGLMVFKEGKLVYWSDQVFSFRNRVDTIDARGKLVQLLNGMYFSKQVQQADFVVEGLIRIKNNYSHENE
jgi:two-component system, NtrC family, nitrogen regulation sensor histidine kinase NtrY